MEATNRGKIKMDELGDSFDCTPAPANFEPLCAIEFDSATSEETVDWLLSKIQTSQSNGGAGLWAKVAKYQPKAVIYVSGSGRHLLIAAELMEMKKMYNDGSLREVSLADLNNFQNAGNIDDFLSLAEKQRIIFHELELIKANQDDLDIAATKTLNLYDGQAIVSRCQIEAVISSLFPLHNKEELKRLAVDWYRRPLLASQPLDRIRSYFGETIAIYFAFLGFYTAALVLPALVGLLSSLAGGGFTNQISFCMLNLVWATLFLEAWKRHSAGLCHAWGTTGDDEFPHPRPAFHGPLGVNPVTGRREPRFQKWRRLVRFYFVTIPSLLACLGVATVVMLLYFHLQHLADENHRDNASMSSTILKYLPSILYAVVITVMNIYYKKLARFLTDFENHRLQTSHQNHYISKLIVFSFANCFMSLFYVAFYLQDLTLLQSHLATLLIIQQVIDQCSEALVPYLVYKRRKLLIHSEARQNTEDSERLLGAVQDLPLQTGIEASKDSYETQVTIEKGMAIREQGTLDDYLELFIQFGYVFLFSSVFPTAAFWALLNNVTEMRTDAFKLCRIFQRPFSQPASGIGVWQAAFELMSIMAVMTNCALIGLSPGIHVEQWGTANTILLFVLAEHLILGLKLLLSYLIPDEPDWVRTALSRVKYESKQAWRKQRTEEAKHLLHCGKDRTPSNQGKLD